MDIRASVKVTKADHPRAEQAGVVQSTDGKEPAKVVTVKFDLEDADGNSVEQVKVADLVQLGSN